MTPTETVELVRIVKAVCPAQQVDEYTTDTWAELLDDLHLADCKTAVKTLGQRQPFIAVSEIRAEVRRIRTDRLDRNPVPEPPAGWDYIEWKRHATKLIADGRASELPAQLDAPTRRAAIEGSK